MSAKDGKLQRLHRMYVSGLVRMTALVARTCCKPNDSIRFLLSAIFCWRNISYSQVAIAKMQMKLPQLKQKNCRSLQSASYLDRWLTDKKQQQQLRGNQVLR